MVHRMPARILIVDDDESMCDLIRRTLHGQGWETDAVTSGRDAIARMDESILCALVDLRMPEVDGLQVLQFIRRHYPDVPVVIVSGITDVKEAVAAMRAGALDYLTKPFDPDELVTLVQKAVGLARTARENRMLRGALMTPVSTGSFFGASAHARELARQIESVAPLDSVVLITGESGVGKSLAARLIHAASGRADGAFITIHCPSLPRDHLEAELFGHELGARPTAADTRVGRVDMAEGGTLFLDEIGDLPLHLQGRLLSLLQDRTFQRLGGRRDLEADVRVIAATRHDLREKVRLREFREDLFYRLHVLPLAILPLRERREDIEPLAGDILERLARERGTAPAALEDDARAALRRYDWPGNIRELENVLERACIFGSGGRITVADLPPEVQAPPAAAARARQLDLAGIPLQDLQRLAARQTLQACHGDRPEAARRLAIAESALDGLLHP